MAAIVVLGVLALVAAIVAWVTWRRGADERHSVQHHQHALETLRQVADRHAPSEWRAPGRGSVPKSGPTVRPASSSARVEGSKRSGAPPRPPRSAPGARSSPPRRRGDAPVSYNDVSLNGAATPPSRGVAPSPSTKESAKVETSRRETVAFDNAVGARTRRAPPTAAFRMGRKLPGAAEQARRDGRARVRRTRVVAGAVVIVVASGVAGALAIGPSHAPKRPPARATSRPSGPITAAGHGLTTTTALNHDLVPTSPTAFSAHYATPSTQYAVAIDASAMCWVMATDPSSGHVVWTGTVAGGSSRSLSVTGGLVVELGAPSDATVTMDGLPVQLPTGFRSPFTLTFGPTA